MRLRWGGQPAGDTGLTIVVSPGVGVPLLCLLSWLCAHQEPRDQSPDFATAPPPPPPSCAGLRALTATFCTLWTHGPPSGTNTAFRWLPVPLRASLTSTRHVALEPRALPARPKPLILRLYVFSKLAAVRDPLMSHTLISGVAVVPKHW